MLRADNVNLDKEENLIHHHKACARCAVSKPELLAQKYFSGAKIVKDLDLAAM
jgi:hypothetical protein